MKKFLLALGVVAALSLLFVGCDKPTDDPEPAGTTFDGNVDLTGKTVKNAAAFAGKWQGGFVVAFGQDVDVSKFSKLVITAKFTDADGAEIAANWGLGQYLLLADATGSWSGDNLLKTQYNLGKEDMSLTGLTGNAGGVAIQSSSDDVKFIEVTSVKFE